VTACEHRPGQATATFPVSAHAPPAANVLAISGPDNVGKSSQLRILARRLGPPACLAGPLSDFDPRWTAIQAAGMTAWWFGRASAGEFADVLACSYLERARHAAGPGLQLVDRGMPMLEATVAATIAVREVLPADRAAHRVHSLLAAYDADIRRAEARELAVCLLHDCDPERGATRSLARSPDPTPVYAAYQRQLHAQMERLCSEGRFAATIVVGELPVMTVQAQIRELASAAGLEVPSCRLPQMSVVAFAGMSESGKSTAAEYLRTRHGFARLKIGHLLEAASANCGVTNPEDADALTQAELMADTLDRYCLAHHFLDRVSIESLHRPAPVTELRKLLGPALTVVHLDTDLTVRLQRGTAGSDDVIARDVIKRTRGADAILSIADEVIVNNRDLLSLCRRLDRLVYARAWARREPVTAPLTLPGLPTAVRTSLMAVVGRLAADPPIADLIAVTGSAARRQQEGDGGDLDVLIVSPAASLPLVQEALHGLQASSGQVKVAVTLLTTAECDAAMVSPRVLRLLAQLGSGDVTCLWFRPGLTLPVPDRAAEAESSVRDAIAIAAEIRRELLDPAPDPASLSRLACRLAEAMLRFEGRPAEAGQALRALVARSPHADTDPGLPGRTAAGSASAAVRARSVLGAWLETIAGHGEARA
jgi:hypothetical protein